MMKESSVKAFEALKAQVKDNLFDKSDVKGVSLQTLLKNNLICRAEEVSRVELNIEKVVELLNEMENDYSSYCCDGVNLFSHYESENGKIYRVDVRRGYRIVE